MSFLTRGLDEGIDLAIETLNETNVEVSIMAITQLLNKMRWLGKDNWASTYIEAYIDNLRGNVNARVMARIQRTEIFKIQSCNYKIIKKKKGMELFGKMIKRFRS